MDNKLAVIGSELPVLQAKGTYKYLKEITGNGAYYQVAKQSITTAFDYIIKHANDLKVNPQNIGIIGFSAGGQLAAVYSCEANN